jgi:hypothetical protein
MGHIVCRSALEGLRFTVVVTVQVQARQTAGQEGVRAGCRAGAFSRAGKGLANDSTKEGGQAPAALGLPAGWVGPRGAASPIFLRAPGHLLTTDSSRATTGTIKRDDILLTHLIFHVRPLLWCAGGRLLHRATESVLITRR